MTCTQLLYHPPPIRNHVLHVFHSCTEHVPLQFYLYVILCNLSRQFVFYNSTGSNIIIYSWDYGGYWSLSNGFQVTKSVTMSTKNSTLEKVFSLSLGL